MQPAKEYNNPVLMQPTGEMPRRIGIIGAGAIGPDIIDRLEDKHTGLLPAAVQLVRELAGRQYAVTDAPVNIAPRAAGADKPHSFNDQRLSAEVAAIIRKAIIDAAAAASLDEALEIGYAAFGESTCTAAAVEGISAFVEKRKPDFTVTG